MKIDFTKELKTLAGESIKGFQGKEKMLLKDVCVETLMINFEDEKGLSGEDKCKRYLLATRIFSNDELEISAEEISLLKKLIGKSFSPLVVGQAYQMLEGR